MFLDAIASAVPPASFSQDQVLRELRQSRQWSSLHERSRQILEKILLGESGIEHRQFAHTNAEMLLSADAEALNNSFESAAPALAGEALGKAMHRAGVTARQIDALFVCTCTGYLCPGLSSFIAERLGLRRDAILHDVVGLGCGAAIPTLRAAAAFLGTQPDAVAAVVAVEICSAAFFLDDDPGVLISFCLFGDGASGSLWRGRGPFSATPWRAGGFRSLHLPSEREKIRFVNDGGKLKNKLHRLVPEVAASAVGELFALEGFNGDAESVHVLAHAGGRDVITALRAVLPGHALNETSDVLRRHGNMSSPSVLFALEYALDSGARGPFWLTSFGAGFAAHSCRLER